MKPFKKELTDFTPFLDFDPEKHIFQIEGVSRPEDVQEFYGPALDWIENYIAGLTDREPGDMNIIFKLTYCNSSSFKFILQILESLLVAKDHDFNITVDWYYDEGDEQMLEDGEDIADAIDVEFNFHSF